MTKKGSVLIISLWIVALFGCLAATIAYEARVNLQLARYGWEDIRGVQLAKAAAWDALAYWRKNSPGYAAFNQPWANSVYFDRHSLDDGTYTAGRDALYGVEDENARLNINTADAGTLARFFHPHEEFAAAVLAWRSPGGGDDALYRDAGYRIRHGPLRSVEELALVRGMTSECWTDYSPDLTVDTDGTVNLNTASPRVLEAVGLSPLLVAKMLRFRAGPDGRVGTADDGVFPDLDSVAVRLGESAPLTATEEESLVNVLQSGGVGVQSHVVRMALTTRLNDGLGTTRVTLVASGRASGLRILQWRETHF